LNGQNHLDVAVILNNLGRIAKTQGELSEARAYFARALAIFRDHLGEGHPDTAMTQEHLEMLPQEILPPETANEDNCDYYKRI
jgi:hypothetical protein